MLEILRIEPYTVFRVGRIITHPDHSFLLKQANPQNVDILKKGGSIFSGTQASKFSSIFRTRKYESPEQEQTKIRKTLIERPILTKIKMIIYTPREESKYLQKSVKSLQALPFFRLKWKETICSTLHSKCCYSIRFLVFQFTG